MSSATLEVLDKKIIENPDQGCKPCSPNSLIEGKVMVMQGQRELGTPALRISENFPLSMHTVTEQVSTFLLGMYIETGD